MCLKISMVFFNKVKATRKKIIYNARFCVSGFYMLANISFADLTDSAISALSNPFRINTFSCFG